ncbi:hypothetical protein BST61_g3112 [Cercospora zeina]
MKYAGVCCIAAIAGSAVAAPLIPWTDSGSVFTPPKGDNGKPVHSLPFRPGFWGPKKRDADAKLFHGMDLTTYAPTPNDEPRTKRNAEAGSPTLFLNHEGYPITALAERDADAEPFNFLSLRPGFWGPKKRDADAKLFHGMDLTTYAPTPNDEPRTKRNAEAKPFDADFFDRAIHRIVTAEKRDAAAKRFNFLKLRPGFWGPKKRDADAKQPFHWSDFTTYSGTPSGL